MRKLTVLPAHAIDRNVREAGGEVVGPNAGFLVKDGPGPRPAAAEC